jgi:hypothetical protein
MMNILQCSGSQLPNGKAPSRAFRLFVLATGVVAAGALCTTPSFAQRDPQGVTSPVPSGPPIPKQGPDNPPNNEELGIALGSFRLYPVLDLRAGYDTNVFAQPAGQQTGSAYGAVRPSLDIRSDWSNHMLNLSASGVFGWYTNANSQNYQNVNVGVDGRFDIQRDWYLTANLGYARTTEALGSPDDAVATSPTVQTAIPANLALYQRFNRLFYQASAGLTRFSYQDFSIPSTTVLPAANRDRSEFGENLRAGYELYEGFDFWVQGGLNQRRYVDTFNVSNQQRNSDGWAITGGSTLDLGGISRLEGFVGFSNQTYQNGASTAGPSGSVSTGAVVFGLAGAWNGYEPLVLRPFIVRSINETAFANYLNYVSTTIGAEFTYLLQSEWKLNGGASFGLAAYTPVQGSVGTTVHTDNFYRASLGLLYSIRPQFDVGPLYEFSAGYGPDPTTSPNYTRHVIMVRFVARR